MRTPGLILFFLPLSGLLGCAGPALQPPPKPFRNPWTEVASPKSGRPESIGTYAAGCLIGGSALNSAGPGYQRVSLSNHRHFGHPALIRFLEELGMSVHAAGEPDFRVGDLGLPRGGPTLSGHASHQIGLDVDLWFQRAPPPAISVLDAQTGKLNPQRFGVREQLLLRRVSESAAVERIFVNPVIKNYLCERFGQAEWIRKIRPWYGHDHHFHVRLHCPADSPACTEGEALPPGNGCDPSLEWWGSDEARSAGEEKMRKPLELPVLPPACESALSLR